MLVSIFFPGLFLRLVVTGTEKGMSNHVREECTKVEEMFDSEMAECNRKDEVKENRKQRAAQLVINEHFVSLPLLSTPSSLVPGISRLFCRCPSHYRTLQTFKDHVQTDTRGRRYMISYMEMFQENKWWATVLGNGTNDM